MEVNISRKKDISTKGYYHIKLIALITMLIDHLPAIIKFSDTTEIALHSIGRIAFPLFAWELVRCYGYSLNKIKHLFSLFYLALLSEPMFDLLFSHTAMDWKSQNVCFTLSLGWICLYILDYDWIGIEICRKKGIVPNKLKVLSMIQWLIRIAFCIVIGIIAQITNCDYGICGIGLIVLFAIADKISKKNFPLEIIVFIIYIIIMGFKNTENVALGLFVYSFCLADIGIIGYYRYKYTPKTDKGVNKALGLFCKWFYPVHLLVLFIIGMILALN